jgi:tripartite-type tricarboxylate transporter receptor subunit TctC
MMEYLFRKKVLLLGCILLMFCAFSAIAAEKPPMPDSLKGKVITWNIGFAAGGGTDLAARTIQPLLKEMYDLDVVVQNIEGGASTIAVTEAVTSPPDGTKVATAGSTILTYMTLGDIAATKISDYTWLSTIHREAVCLVVAANSEINSVEKFVETVKKGTPGSFPIGMAGSVNGPEACLFSLQDIFGDAITTVNYTGASRALTELIGGHIPAISAKVNDMMSQLANGEVRILFSFSYDRIPSLKDTIPAVTEFDWWGDRIPYADPSLLTSYIVAPPGLPEDVKAYLVAAWSGAIGSEKYRAKAEEWNVVVEPIITGEALLDAVQRHLDSQVEMVERYYKNK